MRRISGVVWGAWALAFLAGLGAGGCHWLPVHRVDPALDPRPLGRAGSTDLPRPAAVPTLAKAGGADRGVPLPPLPLQPVSDDEAFAGPAPTPLLDEALARAKSIEASLALGPPVPAPVSTPQAEAPASTPPTDEAGQGGAEDDAPSGLVPTALEPPAELKLPPGHVATAAVVAPRDEQVVPAAIEVDTWAESLGRLAALARRRAESEPGTDAGRIWDLKARLLTWMAEEPPEARTPQDAGAEQAELWNTVMSALAAASASEGTPAEIRAGALALEARSPLTVSDLRLCSKVRGFAQYEPLDPEALRPSQVVVVYCELSGIRYDQPEPGGPFRSRLEAAVEIRPAAGGPARWKQSLGTAEDTCWKPRRDFYVNYRLALPGPAALPPGAYVLVLSQTDLLSGQSASLTLPVNIVADE